MLNSRVSEDFMKIVKIIVDLIDMPIPNWKRAKTVWILIINKLKHNGSFQFNCWSTSYDMFFKHFEQHQAIQFKCENCNQFVRKTQVSLNLVKNDKNECYINLPEFKECSQCEIYVKGKFISKPICLFADICEYSYNKIKFEDIPLQVTIDGAMYHFLCVTFFVNRNHFKSIFV